MSTSEWKVSADDWKASTSGSTKSASGSTASTDGWRVSTGVSPKSASGSTASTDDWKVSTGDSTKSASGSTASTDDWKVSTGDSPKSASGSTASTDELEGVDRRLAEVGQRFDGVDRRLEGVDRGLAEVGQRFAEVGQRFAEVGQRFTSVDQRLDDLGSSLRIQIEAVDSKVGFVLEKVDHLITRDIHHSAVNARVDTRLDNHDLRLITPTSPKSATPNTRLVLAADRYVGCTPAAGGSMNATARRPRVALATLTLSAATVVACATNPATGKKEFSLMSEAQEIQLGQEMDPQIKQEMGVYDDAELQRYVSEIGMRLAKASERPNLPWHFTVVDEPAVNAFALPGGYIYVTRGILAFLHDEEAARRRARTRDRPRHGAPLGAAVHAGDERRCRPHALSIFVPEARPFQGHRRERARPAVSQARPRRRAAGRPAGRATTPARPDGIPPASPACCGRWRGSTRRAAAAAACRTSSSTHPAPADRVAAGARVRRSRTPPLVGTSGRADRRKRSTERVVDGIVFGDSPSDGIVRGNQFLHPDLRLALTFPQGWDVRNSAHAGGGQGAGP